MTTQTYLQSISQDGFALVEDVLDADEISEITVKIEEYRKSKSGKLPGLRNLFTHCPGVKEFAHSNKLLAIANEVLGSKSHPINATLFDKTADANWFVTWHQDRTIVVKEKIETAGYSPWSIKDNMNNVQPPPAILEKMVALRIHLDDCPEENGAIKFVPGSHSHGFIDPENINSFREGKEVVTCPAKRGDVILMRPLILHASSQVAAPKNRRVLHIEYSNAKLPGELRWLNN